MKLPHHIVILKIYKAKKKNRCLFTVTRPTLVHFISKSKVKMDTSEILGLKKLFPVTS